MTEEPAPGRAEPRGMTLLDAISFVVGCGLALALPARIDLAAMTSESFWERLTLAHQLLQRGCLGLALVIFVRRIRYGGPVRPVQLLLLFCAMPILESAVEDMLRGSDVMVLSPARVWWERSTAVACPIAFLAFAMVHKKIPGWANMALLGSAVLTFLGGGIGLLLSFIAGLPAALFCEAEQLEVVLVVFDVVYISLIVFSVGTIYGLPAVQAVWDSPRVGWTGADWTGASLSATTCLLAIWSSIPLIINQATASHGGSPAIIPAAAISFLLALVLCFVLAWRQRLRARRESLSSELA